MASELTRFLGAATARIFGVMALGTTIALALVFWEKLTGGAKAQVVTVHALMVFLWVTLAGMFLIPSQTRQNMRKRETFTVNFFLGLLQIFVILLIVFIAAIMVRRFDIGRPDTAAVIVLLSAPVALVYILVFLFPGAYGRDLATRQDALDAAQRAAWRRDDDNFIPEFASPPEGNAKKTPRGKPKDPGHAQASKTFGP